MMYSLNSAKVTLIANNNLCCCAFFAVLVVGITDNLKFLKYFTFYKSDYFHLYKAITAIVKVISKDSTDERGIILHRDNDVYYWTIKSPKEIKQILFIKEVSGDNVFSLSFNLEDFNDFVNICSKLILPTLSSNVKIHNVLCLASNCEIDQIVNFINPKSCKTFLQSIEEYNEDSIICLMYYREFIIIVHQLKTLFNPLIENDRINSLSEI